MTRIGVAVLAVAVAVLVACNRTTSGDDLAQPPIASLNGHFSLAGLWEGAVAQENGIVQLHSVTFGIDGSFVGSITYQGGAMAGPIERSGTWKVVKDEGRVLTVEVEFPIRLLKGQVPDKTIKTTYTVTFEDMDAIEFSLARPDAQPLRLNRKH